MTKITLPRSNILSDRSRLIVIPIKGSTSSAVMAVIRAGPRYDPVGLDGLSHFVEHMLFRGTKKFPTNMELTKELEKNGAMAEAFSYYETNRYWIRGPRESIDISIENLVDRIYNPLFKKEDVELEKGVIMEERNILLSNPEKLIWEIWNRTLWAENQLGRYYLGSEENIRSFKKEDLINYFKKYYIAPNIFYIVAGDFEREKVMKIFNSLIEKRQTDNKIQRTHLNSSVLRRNKRISSFHIQTETVNISLGFPTIPKGHKDEHALDLISTILSGGMGSRLRRSVMEPGYTYSIESHTEYLSDTGYIQVNLTTEKKNLQKALKVIYENFDRLKNEPVSKPELDLAKGFFSGQLKINTETTYDHCMFYSNQVFSNDNKLMSVKEKISQINQIDVQELLSVSRRYFQSENFYLATVGNIGKLKIIPFT